MQPNESSAPHGALNLLICCAHGAGEHGRAIELAHQLVITDLSGKTSLAHKYLHTGLEIDPNNSSVLVAFGQIDDHERAALAFYW